MHLAILMHSEIVIVITAVGTACAVLSFLSVTPSDNELMFFFFLKKDKLYKGLTM